MHDGHGAVAQTVELVETTGLVARGHHEHVRAGLDQVRELVAEAAVEADLPGEGALECAEHLFEVVLAAAEQDELKAWRRSRRPSTPARRSSPFWPTMRVTEPMTGVPRRYSRPSAPSNAALLRSLPDRSVAP